MKQGVLVLTVTLELVRITNLDNNLPSQDFLISGNKALNKIRGNSQDDDPGTGDGIVVVLVKDHIGTFCLDVFLVQGL